MLKTPKPSLEESEVIALKALAFLANDADRLNRFMALSGMSPADISRSAESTQFLSAVLNHLLQDESLLLTFTADENLDPRLPALAAEILNHPSN